MDLTALVIVATLLAPPDWIGEQSVPDWIDNTAFLPPLDRGGVSHATPRPVVFFPDPTCPSCNELAMRDLTAAGISYRVEDAPAWVTRKLPVVWWTDPQTGAGYHDTYRSVDQVRKAIGNSPSDPTRAENSGPPAVSHSTAGGYYPRRGGNWTHPGKTRAGLVNHLLSGEHAGKFSRGYLETLSYAELESLHSDDHERRVRWQYVERRAERKRGGLLSRAFGGS